MLDMNIIVPEDTMSSTSSAGIENSGSMDLLVELKKATKKDPSLTKEFVNFLLHDDEDKSVITPHKHSHANVINRPLHHSVSEISSSSTTSTSSTASAESDSNSAQLTADLSHPGSGWTNNDIPPLMYSQVTQDGQVHLYKSHRRYIHTAHGWSRTGSASPNDAVASASTGDKIVHKNEAKVVRSLISQLSEKFYSKGWMPGTGGGMSVRIGAGTEEHPYTVFSTPSGIQKEDMIGDDLFELDMEQNVVTPPITPGLKLSSMTNIWFVVYNLRPSATCVIHTHSMYAQLATLLEREDSYSSKADVLQLTHLEMIKGVGNHAYDSVLTIPIIDNQKSESMLAPDMERVIQKYPKCNAVLVRRHGVYVWGDSWEEAKTRLESFDYLFESAIKMKSMGIDCSVVPRKREESEEETDVPNNKKRKLE